MQNHANGEKDGRAHGSCLQRRRRPGAFWEGGKRVLLSLPTQQGVLLSAAETSNSKLMLRHALTAVRPQA